MLVSVCEFSVGSANPICSLSYNSPLGLRTAVSKTNKDIDLNLSQNLYYKNIQNKLFSSRSYEYKFSRTIFACCIMQ